MLLRTTAFATAANGERELLCSWLFPFSQLFFLLICYVNAFHWHRPKKKRRRRRSKTKPRMTQGYQQSGCARAGEREREREGEQDASCTMSASSRRSFLFPSSCSFPSPSPAVRGQKRVCLCCLAATKYLRWHCHERRRLGFDRCASRINNDRRSFVSCWRVGGYASGWGMASDERSRPIQGMGGRRR